MGLGGLNGDTEVLWGGDRGAREAMEDASCAVEQEVLVGPGRQWGSVALGVHLGWEAMGEMLLVWRGRDAAGQGDSAVTGLDAVGLLAWAAFEDEAKYRKVSWRCGAGCY